MTSSWPERCLPRRAPSPPGPPSSSPAPAVGRGGLPSHSEGIISAAAALEFSADIFNQSEFSSE